MKEKCIFCGMGECEIKEYLGKVNMATGLIEDEYDPCKECQKQFNSTVTPVDNVSCLYEVTCKYCGDRLSDIDDNSFGHMINCIKCQASYKIDKQTGCMYAIFMKTEINGKIYSCFEYYGGNKIDIDQVMWNGNCKEIKSFQYPLNVTPQNINEKIRNILLFL